MGTLRRWCYALIEPIVMSFYTLVFPNTKPSVIQALYDNVPDGDEKLTRTATSESASRAYLRAKNPKSSYRIFYLRVVYFGWNISHALQTPDRKNEIALSGHHYNLREIYNNAPKPLVNYQTFHNRVVRLNWPIRSALYTRAYE